MKGLTQRNKNRGGKQSNMLSSAMMRVNTDTAVGTKVHWVTPSENNEIPRKCGGKGKHKIGAHTTRGINKKRGKDKGSLGGHFQKAKKQYHARTGEGHIQGLDRHKEHTK